jgi:hypothetical protein
MASNRSPVSLSLLRERVEFGNAGTLDTHGTGWFVGFSDWTRSALGDLRHVAAGAPTAGLCIKWFAHAAGDPNGEAKPISEGRSLSVLVSPASEFRIEFSSTADFAPEATISHTLRRQGDFVVWGEGVHHRAFGMEAACVMTVRWTPG